ncbi:MAG: aldo/keto reductase [Sphaerochaetaceae bacterium]|jgi:diketogulonate reductase-like aldo/keto reductase
MVTHKDNRIVLNNTIAIPPIGLGLFKMGSDAIVTRSVHSALRSGYRLFDTASIYGNEHALGKALKSSPVEREEIFITSKVWNSDHGYEKTLKAFDHTLKTLGTDYLDLYLIHWPGHNDVLPTYKALETLYEEKKVRTIGVSNFEISHLEKLLDHAHIIPAINQIEVHPLFQQRKVREFCEKHSIQIQSYSPLVRGSLDIPLIQSFALKYQKSVAQVVLRWHIQHNMIPIPKSVHPHRIKENIEIFDFSLTQQEMDELDALESDKRIGFDPRTFF